MLIQNCESTSDIQSKLKRLFAGTIEQMLEAEMDEHLGYEKHSFAGNNSGNSRNGYNHKNIISDYGESDIAIPRDRNGQFEPKVIEKWQTRTSEIEQKIMSMYAKGMSQRDIEDSLHEIYGSVNIDGAKYAKVLMSLKHYHHHNIYFNHITLAHHHFQSVLLPWLLTNHSFNI